MITPWLTLRPQGLYCEPADAYVDPRFPVARAIVTHGHADHARPGHEAVLATPETIAIMRARYKDAGGISPQPLAYHEPIDLSGVKLSFLPAGHILGSAQAVLEYQGQRVIVSGDYKRRRDPTCALFEPMACDIFITEATFGMPVFTHPDDGEELGKLLQSLYDFPDRAHLVGAYALGKCQRIMLRLRELGYTETIYLHGAMVELTRLYESLGVQLGSWETVVEAGRKEKNEWGGKLILCPPSALMDRWSRRFGEPVIAMASGWMRIRAHARTKGIELPIILSDHADWPELVATLEEVHPARLLVTHGVDEALVYYSRERGIPAEALHVAGLGEEEE